MCHLASVPCVLHRLALSSAKTAACRHKGSAADLFGSVHGFQHGVEPGGRLLLRRPLRLRSRQSPLHLHGTRVASRTLAPPEVGSRIAHHRLHAKCKHLNNDALSMHLAARLSDPQGSPLISPRLLRRQHEPTPQDSSACLNILAGKAPRFCHRHAAVLLRRAH